MDRRLRVCGRDGRGNPAGVTRRDGLETGSTVVRLEGSRTGDHTKRDMYVWILFLINNPIIIGYFIFLILLYNIIFNTLHEREKVL